MFKQAGILADDDPTDDETPKKQCCSTACLKDRFENAKLCYDHAIEALQKKLLGKLDPGDPKEIQEHIKSLYIEQPPPQLQIINDILNGKDSKQLKVWCIDTEFSWFGQIVNELAVVDCQSNEIALSALVKHIESMRAQRKPLQDSFMRNVLRSREASTDHKFSRPSETKSMEVDEIVRIWQESISPKDFICEQSLSPMDIRNMRNMFASYGRHDVLPPDDHCISIITLLKKFLPKGTSVVLN